MPQTARRLTPRSASPARSLRQKKRHGQTPLPFPGPVRATPPPVRRVDDDSRQKRHLARLLFSLLTAILIANALIGERGLPATLEIRREHQRLTERIAALRAENQRLRREAERLRHDPAAIERLARANLGLVRPGERLFIVADGGAPASPDPRSAVRRAAARGAETGGLLDVD